MNTTATKDAIDLGRDWAERSRWDGIDRDYTPEDVIRLRGSLRIEHTLARHGAEKLWRLLAEEDYVAALGAITGGQAVQMAKAGLKAIYLSGWQVAADGNLAGDVYPDQSLYPANSVPGNGAPAQQRAPPRRPDRVGRGQGGRGRLPAPDRRRRGGRFRRAAERVRADEGDDRGRRRGRPLRGPALLGEEVRPPRREGARPDRASSSARSSRPASPPTSSACRRSSSPAPTPTRRSS